MVLTVCPVVSAAMNIMAGATVGGGTRVNWAVSFKTPLHVRKEWAEKNGLPNFMSLRYEEAMNAVCKRLGVKTGTSSIQGCLHLYKRIIVGRQSLLEMLDVKIILCLGRL